MRALLDTNVMIAEQVPRGYELSVSSLSWAELGYGVRKAADPLKRAQRESQVARLRSFYGAGISFDDGAAYAYETICGLVIASGRKVRRRAIDLMIAATAAANGAAVITNNVDDFAGIEDFVQIIHG